MWTYIEETRHTTGNLEQRVSSAKDNVEAMNNIMAKWCDYPLYERKEKRGLLNLDVSIHYSPTRSEWAKLCHDNFIQLRNDWHAHWRGGSFEIALKIDFMSVSNMEKYCS